MLFERATFLVISNVVRKPHADVHRFEKVSNIIKQFKLSCSKSAAHFAAMQVRNSHFSALIEGFTSTTYAMVITSDPGIQPASILINIETSRTHFESLIATVRCRVRTAQDAHLPCLTAYSWFCFTDELCNHGQFRSRWCTSPCRGLCSGRSGSDARRCVETMKLVCHSTRCQPKGCGSEPRKAIRVALSICEAKKRGTVKLHLLAFLPAAGEENFTGSWLLRPRKQFRNFGRSYFFPHSE